MLWKRGTLVLLLMALAVVGPIVAYAGLTVIYPKSTHTVNVNTTPPLTFSAGGDYATAVTNGFASAFTQIDNNAAFTITLSGLAGGNVTLDNYTMITKTPGAVTSWKMQIGTGIAGTLDATEIVSLKIRLWTGGVAPTTDNSAGICAILDLEAAVNTESTGTCSANFVKVQVVYELNGGSAGASTVAIRPSSIVFP